MVASSPGHRVRKAGGYVPDVDLRHLEVTLRVATSAGPGVAELHFDVCPVHRVHPRCQLRTAILCSLRHLTPKLAILDALPLWRLRAPPP